MSPFETVLRNLDSLSLKELSDLQGFINERIAELAPSPAESKAAENVFPADAPVTKWETVKINYIREENKEVKAPVTYVIPPMNFQLPYRKG